MFKLFFFSFLFQTTWIFSWRFSSFLPPHPNPYQLHIRSNLGFILLNDTSTCSSAQTRRASIQTSNVLISRRPALPHGLQPPFVLWTLFLFRFKPFFFCIAVQTQYLYLFIYSTLAFLILLCHVLYCWASMPRVSNKEKASGRNQKPNYWGLIDMRSCRTKEQNQCPKGVKNVTQSYDLPPKLSPISYWLWARTLHQDHTDDTPSLKVRRPQITLHSPEALCCETSVSYSSCRKGLTLRNIFDFAWAKLQFTGVCSRMTSPNHVRHFL